MKARGENGLKMGAVVLPYGLKNIEYFLPHPRAKRKARGLLPFTKSCCMRVGNEGMLKGIIGNRIWRNPHAYSFPNNQR